MHSMEVAQLFRFNEWWETGRLDPRRLQEYKRHLSDRILKFLPDRQIVLVTGLRRVGKTTLLYQTIQHLLDQGVEPRRILYFSFDEERFDLTDVMQTYASAVLRESLQASGRLYVFLDEIHRVDNWEGKVKTYYDLNPDLRFFLSASAALILSRKTKESLAGRVYEFLLKPLAFKEFLQMRGIQVTYQDAEMLSERILPYYFMDFIRKAGFPEIVHQEDEEKIIAYVRSSVVDRVIYIGPST